MNENKLRAKQLLINKWLIPAYIFLAIALTLLILEVLGITGDEAAMGVVVAMNLFLAGILFPIYGKLSEISTKIR